METPSGTSILIVCQMGRDTPGDASLDGDDVGLLFLFLFFLHFGLFLRFHEGLVGFISFGKRDDVFLGIIEEGGGGADVDETHVPFALDLQNVSDPPVTAACFFPVFGLFAFLVLIDEILEDGFFGFPGWDGNFKNLTGKDLVAVAVIHVPSDEVIDDFAFLEGFVRAVVFDFDPHAKGLFGGRGIFVPVLGETAIEVGLHLDVGDLVGNPGVDECLVLFAQSVAVDGDDAATLEPDPGMGGIGFDQFGLQGFAFGVGELAVFGMGRSDQGSNEKQKGEKVRFHELSNKRTRGNLSVRLVLSITGEWIRFLS